MARFVPPLRVSSGRSPAERRVLDWLSRLDDRWAVVHSLGVLDHPFKRWAEVDALVVGPPGLVVLEVKGGRVARRNGIWEFTDRVGQVTRKREGPFDQAGGAEGALRRFLVDCGALRPDQCSGYAVAMPDVTFGGRSPDVIVEVLLDASSSWSAPDRVLARWCRYWAARTGCTRELTGADVAGVVDALRADLDLRPSLSLLATEVDRELTRVTIEQGHVLASGVDNPRLVVAGRAGTGKTMLAVAEARRLAAEGRRVLLSCSTPPLAQRLRMALGETDEVVVRTYDNRRERAPSSGDPLPALTAGPSAEPLFDAVVVDEAQDLGPSWRELFDARLVGGADEGTWRLFLDPAQDLVGGPTDASADLSASAARMRLTRNCRNTRQIAVVASMLTRTELDAEAPVTGPEVVKHWWSNREQHDRLLADQLRQLAGTLPPEDVAVLTRHPMASDRLAAIARTSGVRLTTLADACPGAAVVATAEEFKGLEAVAVVLADVNSLGELSDRRHCYVACTRARVSLTLLLHESVRETYDEGAAWFGRVLTQRIHPHIHTLS